MPRGLNSLQRRLEDYVLGFWKAGGTAERQRSPGGDTGFWLARPVTPELDPKPKSPHQAYSDRPAGKRCLDYAAEVTTAQAVILGNTADSS